MSGKPTFPEAFNMASYFVDSNIEAGRKALPDHLLARAARMLDVPQIAIKHPVKDSA